MISIIIPAHNEANVIRNAVTEYLPGIDTGEIEVIIVCNGCSDNTKDIVTSLSKEIKCIETAFPSKTNALNLGDAEAIGFPRIYQDADVVVSLDTIRKIDKLLESGKFIAASPKMKMDVRKASWTVRSYYEIWQGITYVQEGMIGTGIYALSEAARKKFDKFPKIIADDGYIRALFKTEERTTLDNCCSIVRSPTNLNGLLKIKTRSRLGRYELKKKYPHLIKNEQKNYKGAFLKLVKQIDLWPKIVVYFYVNMLSRFRAKKHIHHIGFSGWERDDSSRQVD
ncbi:hypothetical protein DSCO28_18690 [Desulfosarcina ovata subsp. sediminis]|uniref:Glycosyltransferase 2-like domain-containing protein n=1 Tax=Desulfosarcina ovata subsp. sediminis TaxID=885957 RepID=A0A5K7ZRE1_9BACT|nr:glycosyltransferase family 2 protein [Desulfosarcina ovata]BBO81303.1 hypothetical protein DSCO28_18690 [Desulfosarcina ovata subsp. sediminis]